MSLKLNRDELRLGKLEYRNRSHARMDFSRFVHDVNRYLQDTLPAELRFRMVIRDHFYDRLMDRKADPKHIKELIMTTIQKKLCQILYFAVVEKESPRLIFTDSIHHVMATWNEHDRSIVIRTYMYQPDRHMGKTKEFSLNPHI